MSNLFEISSSDNDAFFWSGPVPHLHQSLIIPSMNSLALLGGWGHMLFQHKRMEEFEIWFSSYHVKQRRRFKVRADTPVIEFSFLIHNSIAQRIHTPYDNWVEETQFNIFYLPPVEDQVQFEPGLRYTTLDVHCTTGFLQRLAPYYPEVLQPFLNAIDAGRLPAQIFPHHMFATQNMVNLANWILQLLRAPIVDGLTLELAVKLLLYAALACKTDLLMGGRIVPLSKISEINRVSTVLLKNLTAEPNFRALSQQARMDETYLKKLFAKRFNQPPYSYWQEHRMNEAFTRVVHTNEPLTDIALDMGFSAVSNFSKAFKKIYHFTPSYYRK
ncbi:AraC family transcriptional regulator [Niabella sp. CC-SYL272]|uniref:helix-turn-helix domain-containing protein n=1 Tax=Niabella agricola TaxID=2891571 RepID=UPI001F2C2E6C|nr:AraC family transcriptional regulator [Niabella agricola]MCF3111675.1 AraC family transcriptional regulator [Niabella agricola]